MDAFLLLRDWWARARNELLGLLHTDFLRSTIWVAVRFRSVMNFNHSLPGCYSRFYLVRNMHVVLSGMAAFLPVERRRLPSIMCNALSAIGRYATTVLYSKVL